MVANDPLAGLVLILVLLAIILTDRCVLGNECVILNPEKPRRDD